MVRLADAYREFIRLAGVTPPAPAPAPNPQPSTLNPQRPFDWPTCAAALTTEHQRKLAGWRSYSPKFVEWLRSENLLGLFDGERIAFPVHDAQGRVVGCHYRLKEDGSWRYSPTGTRTTPLIIGDIGQAQTIYGFESQWDMLAVLDACHWHIQPPDSTCAVATRGASNGRLLAGLCRQDATVCAFAQNDEAGAKWLVAIAAACGCRCVHVVTPSPHKDLNDWTRAGAVAADIRHAISEAQPVTVSNAPAPHAAPPVSVSESSVTLPETEEEAPAPEFPVDALPPRMASFVAAVSRCGRVPPALPAVCALGVASSAIGAGLEVVSGPNRTTRANLFLLASADARKLVDNLLGRYNPGKTTDESLYLSAFSGDFVRVDRQGRDAVVLNKPCLALCWFIQPDLLATMLDEQTLSTSGFLPRLLVCHTHATPRKTEGAPQTLSETARSQWTQLIADLLAAHHAAGNPHRIEATPEALALLNGFHNQIVDRRAADLADVGAFAARYAENAWRLSVVFHAAFHGGEAQGHPLAPETARNAVQVVEWFIAGQLDILAKGRRATTEKLEDEVLELLEANRERKGQDFNTAREVQRERITTESGKAIREQPSRGPM